jgi:hypothetical protein
VPGDPIAVGDPGTGPLEPLHETRNIERRRKLEHDVQVIPDDPHFDNLCALPVRLHSHEAVEEHRQVLVDQG